MTRQAIEELEAQVIALSDTLRVEHFNLHPQVAERFDARDADHLGTLASNLHVLARFAERCAANAEATRKAVLK